MDKGLGQLEYVAVLPRRVWLDDDTSFRRYGSAQLAYESLNALIVACKPVPIDQIPIVPVGLRTPDSSNSIISRYASLH